ncbi:MAG TPA: hypothetical protein VK427_24555, partial [Kofleriaceae bacterium]|nr:hypothetical protein [Kofleriaceae bacterium]
MEERIAQRIAERTSGARLHEQSRADAAAHARNEVAVRTSGAGAVLQPSAPADVRASQYQPPAEVAAAIASLPPELQAFISQRPDGAMRAIDELNEALRSVELLSRAAAHGTPFEPTRGPRLMMPAGLGGLVAAIDRAHTFSDQQAILAGRAPLAPLRLAHADASPTSAMPAMPPAARAAHSALRVPAMSFLSAPSARAIGGDAPTTALQAATSAKPAALSHVAWADRWLARFAGASQQSLDTMTVASGFDRSARMQALVSAAPSAVFVAPMFDIERAGEVVRFDAAGHAVVSPSRAAQVSTAEASNPSSDVVAPRLRETLPEVVRYADDAETPDDVFAAIAMGATRARAEQVLTPSAAPSGASQAAPPSVDRYTAADAVAHAAPRAPGAGFAAQLASSPFAPALRHVLPLPTAPTFDVRALFGGGLSATYLAGLLGASSDEIQTVSRMLPSWGAWSEQPASIADGFAPASTREVPAFDATYVAPEASAFGDAGAGADVEAALSEARPAAPAVAARTELEAATTQLTTLRTALLSWNVEATPDGQTFAPAGDMTMLPAITSSRAASPMSTATARTMLETMNLPMLGDAADAVGDGAAWTAPGMVADRAHAWSVAQERSSADLSFDFVPPELVLAARVYGLGPAEAAQAARLALAGPGHLTAMAGTVDRTFVQAMTVEAERRSRATHQLAAVYPSVTGELVAATTPGARVPASRMADAGGDATAESLAAASIGPASMFTSSGTAFGVDRKAPRGAFLWPSATIAALGLHAAAPDGQQSMSVAALELLAAQAVAELGTYTALADRGTDEALTDGAVDPQLAGSTTRGSAAEVARGSATGASAPGAIGAAEPAEADVLASAAALVPSAWRARFDAMYV